MASSDKAYGAHDVLPYKEDTALEGRAPYDVSKSCADLIARSFRETYDVPVLVTRCANLFGGGDLNFNRLIPGTIRSALAGTQPVVRSDGTLIRDYLYVRDAAAAYVALAERALRGEVKSDAFNFGLDQPMTVLEVVDRVLKATGREDLEPVILGEASHEIPKQYMDCSRARSELNWQPGPQF